MKIQPFIGAWLFSLCVFTSQAQMPNKDLRADYEHAITNARLVKAKKLGDLIPDYPSNWITDKDYKGTEIHLENKVELGKNDQLTEKQLLLLHDLRLNRPLKIKVLYKNENAITGKRDDRIMDYSLTLVPDTEAVFPGGNKAFYVYLKDIPVVEEVQRFSFWVNKNGEVKHLKVMSEPHDKEVLFLLKKALNKMPDWNPATLQNGKRVKQHFLLTLGNAYGC